MNFLVGIFFKPFQWVFSFLFGIITFIIIVLAAVALTFNHWSPKVVPLLLGGGSDFTVSIGRSHSNVFTMNFNFYDVAIQGGSLYPVSTLAQIDRLGADLLFLSLLTKKVVVENFVLDVPQITCVRDGDGNVNIADFLSSLFGQRERATKPGVGKKPAKPRQIFFRHVEIRVGRVALMDFTEQPAKVREFALNYSYEADNVDAETLFKRLSSDLNARGAGLLMQSVLRSLANLPDLATVANDILQSDGRSGGIVGDFWKRLKKSR
ncbi:MAG: hypothetical protein LBP65_03375 [Puniceicoccales bacterium]|jgi:hypothetical protein|nr:hypothetical protein [Puniceicoccales bacterium]